MPGFDPREPETYWGLFRRESRLAAVRRGLTVTVGDPERTPDGLALDWDVSLDGQATRYTLLRWDDIVRARFPRSNGRRLVAVPALWWRLLRSGYLRPFRREARRFARVIIGVHLIYLFLVVSSLAAATGLVALAADLATPWAYLAVPPLAYAILAGLMRVTRGKPFYVAHLVDDTAFTHDHAGGAETRMRDRLDAFADIIRRAEGHTSEIVVIGHSSSSFLGLEALDRILNRDPEFGRRGTPVSFVSIGSVIPWITLDPRAAEARAALARVAACDAILWLDVRAKWDWLSVHQRNPLSASKLPAPMAHRPVEIHVRIDDLIEKRIIARRKWNLFRMHFQLLMSSRDPEAFDYIAFVAGPEPVHALIRRWRDVGEQPKGRVTSESAED
ncbi:hydrolase [Methylobacterium sp. J-068]|uniref:hydrolase n=1 Tax=Methylobacterium sp. J-068 TaxID=2836649 RepID=UPI001FBB218A|nr:hydrolase [Methylobacterium sp. J-068]MCJ2034667.1 hydrolase [Methylobacterium sp. J-068]